MIPAEQTFTKSHSLILSRPVAVGLSVITVCVLGVFWMTRGVLADSFSQLDNNVLQWFQDQRSPGLDKRMLELTALGSYTVLTIFVFSAISLLIFCKKYRRALFVFICIIGATLLTFSSKELIERPRPDVPNALFTPSSDSFPSGHAFVSITVYLTFAWFVCPILPTRSGRIYMELAAILLSIAIGVSRLYLGVHYLTDVVAGWMAGLAWVTTCWLWLTLFYRRHDSEFESNLPRNA